MLDPIVALWDCAPLQVILEEAGGTYTDWRGNATIHAGEGIATNGRLFEQVLRTIQQA
jgi:fructose-1,6-bisphosphatase/inositol monophosphatase family enzyme